MDTPPSTAERRARYEHEQLSARGMRLLTGGLTEQGDAFLVGVGAVALFGILYPLVDGWALLAFPVVYIGAVIARRQLRRDRKPGV
jgi:hypothetical protein